MDKFDTQHERLAYARSEAGFNFATDAARYFGWNENSYRSHENGMRGIGKKAAQKYAAGLKINVSWLLYGMGPMKGGENYSEREMALIDRYRDLSEKEQAAFETMLNGLAKR